MSGTGAAASGEPARTAPLWDFVLYFLWLGTTGFGGPIALTGYMQRDLVERRGWVSEQDYKEGLSLAQLAPGPLAAQLAIYLGWVRAGNLGATLVGLAFIAPSLIMVLALSVAYVRFGGLPWMQGLFYGIGAAVIAIIVQSALKLTRITPGRDRFLWVIFGISALVTAWTESEIFTLFIAAGLTTVLVRRIAVGRGWQAVLLPVPLGFSATIAEVTSAGLLSQIFLYFGQASLVVFGSGLAIIPFLYGGTVQQFHWLTERQFLDAVAVSMITPGPVVITVAFIGYLVAGLWGSLAAALGMFLPTYLAVVLAAPHYRRLANNLHVRAFVDGVTAAAIGAIAGAAFVLGRRALIDLPTVLIALAVLSILRTTKRIPDPVLIALAGVAGLLLWGANSLV
ncbi:MAG TPA: chromate transporter [Gemmatimonadales bacterium]|nr:chromate transporter [Gemmatimonadales bacterium]